MVDRRCRRRPARPGRRTLRNRAHNPVAHAADRAPSSHRRRRRMRAHCRAAASLQSHASASRKRFGAAAQLYALRRADESGRDQGIGDFSALALAGEKAGQAGAAYLGVSPLHMLFPRDRGRASPYYPSDRRFLDPIFIDVQDDSGLPRDEALNAALASLAPQFAAASATKSCRVRGGVARQARGARG